MNRQYCFTVTGKNLYEKNIWVVTFPKDQPREKDFYAITNLEFVPGYTEAITTYANPVCLFTKAEAEKFHDLQPLDKRDYVFTIVKKSELKLLAAERKLKCTS
jgi:hypothetical protein